jgi:hypothetical protein
MYNITDKYNILRLLMATLARSIAIGNPNFKGFLSGVEKSRGLSKRIILHDGCCRCCMFYIGHHTANCNGNFPDGATYWTLTQANAEACARVVGVHLQVKQEPIGATI